MEMREIPARGELSSSKPRFLIHKVREKTINSLHSLKNSQKKYKICEKRVLKPIDLPAASKKQKTAGTQLLLNCLLKEKKF
jgi:hypothetical protein